MAGHCSHAGRDNSFLRCAIAKRKVCATEFSITTYLSCYRKFVTKPALSTTSYARLDTLVGGGNDIYGSGATGSCYFFVCAPGRLTTTLTLTLYDVVLALEKVCVTAAAGLDSETSGAITKVVNYFSNFALPDTDALVVKLWVFAFT